jgi:carbon-monoxide dehydrogenase large subunit
VVAVLTADDLKPVNLHWMPTLGGDVQAVLADKKVCFQMQEVAMVLATDRYAAADGVALVEVDYEELPAIVDPKQSMAPDAPVIREDIADKTEVGHGPRTHHNHIFTWEAGDKAAADAAFASAAVTVREEILNPRVHPCPLETCGCVASFNKATGYLTVYMTTQAPHLVRTVLAMLSGMAESKIRVVGGDIGGGFGNKVPVYPGYVVAIVASIVTGVPVKWIEDRGSTTSRPPASPATTTATASSRPTPTAGSGPALHALADHGAFNSHVSTRPSCRPAVHICTGSYDIPNAYCRVDAVYTNKAPGGVAYRCSLRVTEAVYLIERMIDVLALKLGIDKAEIRRRNFIKAEQFPYTTAFGWTLRLGRLPHRARQGAEGGRLRRPAPRAGGQARRPECPT